DAPSAFPFWIGPDVEVVPARAAWCYGDPGIAAALLVAATSGHRADWQQIAIDLAERTAARPASTTGVSDAGLCHGAAGLGHIFNRCHHATGSEQFATAARCWFRRAIDMVETGEQVPGFLEGSTGVALALLSASTHTVPAWDAVLAISPARS